VKQKTATLENVVEAWRPAPADRRAAALRILQGGEPATADRPLVYRWPAAARKLSITPRALHYAVEIAGIEPVRLPGRNRAIGIRSSDLDRLAGGC
jgi:hypothetical protein